MEGYIPCVERPTNSSNEIQSPGNRSKFLGISPLKEVTNISTPTDRPFRVSIEGNIGAGKSTLIEYFKSYPEIEAYGEPLNWWRNLEGHNLLELLYLDIDKWYSTFQMYVQLTRLKVQTSKPSNPNTMVQMFERSVQSNRFCFLEQAFRNGFLHKADYAISDQWYRWIRANVDIKLDLIVYLRSTPEIVYERVINRERPEETGISLEYLKQLHESHEQWLMSNDERFNTVPVLVLNADETFENIREQYKLYEKKILGYEKRKRSEVDNDQRERVKKILKM